MKKLLFLGLILLVACTPVRYVYIDVKDSTNFVEVKKRIIYDDVYIPSMFPYTHNYIWYNNPYYNPIIIRTPIRVQQPQQKYTPRPRYTSPSYTPQKQIPPRVSRFPRETP
jgi:hypothetical protein